MNKFFSLKKRMVLSVCLLFAVIIAAVGVSSAIYTSQDHQRSVVRNRDNETIRFSSDKLYRVVEGTQAQKYYCPMDKMDKTMRFYVCNYDQAKTTLFCEKDLEYTINFTVNNGTGNGDVYIISNGSEEKHISNGSSCSFTDVLVGGRKSLTSYAFTFEEGDFNKVELNVTVIPVNLDLTQKRILNGILVPIEYASTQGLDVKREFTDSTRGTPDMFDAYNMLVTISGGEGDALITWDNTELDIDPFFASGKTMNVNDKQSSISVPMNSEDGTGSYLVQFYNHNSEKPTWTKWTDLPVEVTLQTKSVQTENK